ncbi:hypothetical protein ACOU9P_002825 [Enterococcus faecium]|uniref:hypothetical protein n=1 Tax=Enterococcus faecium TaxID=1352 RepID=UPI000DEB3187|nr:hypothetical protein [Enterococcus faecium]EMF0445294.1 hypothetical protein [Enterococcus faecium]RBS36324.1 hypothetical protein EB16_02734 [Enterococcus faecium]TKN48909.1 hypothetical protein DVW96_07510 [Enterococcus faecium]TKN96972.1 hypothetical protein DVX31_07635 [Enterococcus faecium]TKQ74500.1 hypothetical protein DV480_13480 [Enterococcus faecium]
MKKYFVLLISLILGIVIVSGCSSNKKSEDTQKVIDKIIKYETEVNNADYDKGKEKYNYTEDDFSFLIYYDKDQKLYLVDSWVPFKNKMNDMQYKWGVSLDKNEIKRFKYDSDFDGYKKSGDYEIIYKSGKFVD